MSIKTIQFDIRRCRDDVLLYAKGDYVSDKENDEIAQLIVNEIYYVDITEDEGVYYGTGT